MGQEKVLRDDTCMHAQYDANTSAAYLSPPFYPAVPFADACKVNNLPCKAQGSNCGTDMDPDSLFLGTVATCITTVFVLGVTTGCGCTHWLRKASKKEGHALQYSARRTREAVDQEIGSRKIPESRSSEYPYTFALNLEPGRSRNPAFLTKEELKKVSRASKNVGTQPDTSKIIRKPRSE